MIQIVCLIEQGVKRMWKRSKGKKINNNKELAGKHSNKTKNKELSLHVYTKIKLPEDIILQCNVTSSVLVSANQVLVSHFTFCITIRLNLDADSYKMSFFTTLLHHNASHIAYQIDKSSNTLSLSSPIVPLLHLHTPLEPFPPQSLQLLHHLPMIQWQTRVTKAHRNQSPHSKQSAKKWSHIINPTMRRIQGKYGQVHSPQPTCWVLGFLSFYQLALQQPSHLLPPAIMFDQC